MNRLHYRVLRVWGLIAMVALPGMAAAQDPLRSAHFVLIVPGNRGGDLLLDELEVAYQFVRTWGLRLPARIDVRGYSTTDSYVRGSGAVRTTLASTVDGTVHLQPHGLLLRSGSLQRTFRHELVHVALRDAERRGIPRWFNEGLAMHVAEERHPQAGHFRTLPAMERALGEGRDHRGTRSAYECARRLVERLEREHGRSALTDIVQWTSTRGEFPVRFRQVIGAAVETWVARGLRP